ncbi:unnamed protein product [Rotaria sp. Silwood2]|nr:unnamed protein product [Rotaria sp. Silwood2]
MTNKYYLLSLILLLFVCFAHNEATPSAATDSTTQVEVIIDSTTALKLITDEISTSKSNSTDMETLASTASDLTTASALFSTSHSITNLASTATSTASDLTTASASFSTSHSTTNLASTARDLTTASASFSTSHSTTNLASSVNNQSGSSTIVSVLTTDSNIVHSVASNSSITYSPAISDLSSISSITSHTSNIPTSIISTVPTTVIGTNINETYIYTFESEYAIKIGIINDSNTTASVERMVNASFNLTDFKITVTKIEITLKAKIVKRDYNMLVDIWFRSSRINCNLACIDKATLIPTIDVSLSSENDTLVSVNFTSKPERVISSFTSNPSITYSSATSDLSSISSTAPYTSNISTGTTSTVPTTTAIGTNISETYVYTFQSEYAIKIGIINDFNTTASVERMVNASFNLTDFKITVTKIEITPKAKIVKRDYNMLVDIWFRSSRINCDLACIDKATLTPTVSGPSPGIPGQLGMGLGISLFGVLLIVEIIVLYLIYR